MEEFDKWNTLKQELDRSADNPNRFPKVGEVWMSSVGKNIGYEQNGGGENFSRPLLIIKKFNNHMFWCVPLSTKQKNFDFYYNFTDPENKNVSIILAQLKLTSIKRMQRKMYDLESNHINEVKIRLLQTFIA